MSDVDKAIWLPPGDSYVVRMKNRYMVFDPMTRGIEPEIWRPKSKRQIKRLKTCGGIVYVLVSQLNGLVWYVGATHNFIRRASEQGLRWIIDNWKYDVWLIQSPDPFEEERQLIWRYQPVLNYRGVRDGEPLPKWHNECLAGMVDNYHEYAE